jgi:hypothetical protein
MAITRAQQVRQMLEDGGMLVSPSTTGKRPGYRGRGAKDPREVGFDAKEAAANVGKASTKSDFDASADRVAAATNIANMQKALGTKGNISKQQQDARDRISDQRDRTIEAIAEQRKKAISGNGIYSSVVKPNFLEGLNNLVSTFSIFDKFRNNPINEKKYVEYLKSQGVDTTDLEEIFDIDDEGKVSKELFEKFKSFKPNFDLEQQRNLFKNLEEAGDPFAKASAFPMDFKSFLASEGNFGLITGGDLGNLKDFKNPGTVIDPTTGLPYTDAEFEKLKRESGQGGSSYDRGPSDPCKGPNPPAYCFIGQNADDTEDEEGNTNRERGLALRFLNRGGSPMDAPTEGGIMDLETGRQMYFLGKLVKKATRAVKKIAKSPLGKAAILGGAAYFAGQGGGLGALLKKAAVGAPTDLVTGKRAFSGLFGTGGEFNLKAGLLGQNPFLTFGGLAAILPFLSEDEQQQLISSRGVNIDPGYIRDNPYTFASKVGSGSGTAFALAADGGRIGLEGGTNEGFQKYLKEREKFEKERSLEQLFREFQEDLRRQKVAEQKTMAADGGRIGYQEGSKEPVAKKTMPLLDMGGKEMDLRDDGGFVPIGRMEKADDVPARLSKNEFVFTADAVRNAGEGDVDKGAEVMYNMMKNLESGGEVSEESQGLSGAREMFQTSKRLEEVL